MTARPSARPVARAAEVTAVAYEPYALDAFQEKPIVWKN